MKNILFPIILFIFSSAYPLHYKPIYNPSALKEITCTKLAHNLITYDSKELIDKMESKKLPQELIDTIRRELISENLLLYWDAFKLLIIPEVKILPKPIWEGYFQEFVQGADSLLLLQRELEQVDAEGIRYKWSGVTVVSYPSLKKKSFIKCLEPILSIVMIPFTHYFFTAHKDTICLWDIDQGVCIKKFKKELCSRCYFAVNPQRTLLLLYSDNIAEKSITYSTLDLTSLPESSLVQVLKRDYEPMHVPGLVGIAFTPQGNALLEVRKFDLAFLDLTTLQWHILPHKEEEQENEYIARCTISQDGTFLLTSSLFGCYTYDLKNIERTRPVKLKSLNGEVMIGTLSPNSKNIIIEDRGQVYLWDINSPIPVVINDYPVHGSETRYIGFYWDQDKVKIYIFANDGSLENPRLLIYDIEESLKGLSVAELVLIAKLKKFGWKTLNDPYYSALFENCKHKDMLASYFKIPSLASTMINTYHKVQSFFHS